MLGELTTIGFEGANCAIMEFGAVGFTCVIYEFYRFNVDRERDFRRSIEDPDAECKCWVGVKTGEPCQLDLWQIKRA